MSKLLLRLLLVIPLVFQLASCANTSEEPEADELADSTEPEDFSDEDVVSDDSNAPSDEEAEKEAEKEVAQEEEVNKVAEEEPPPPVEEPPKVAEEEIPVEAPEIKKEEPLPPPTPVAEKPKPVKEKEESSEQTLESFLAGQTTYRGRRINIEVQDEDIRNVFRLIAEESGANLVLDEKVGGKLTVKLRQIPWDQALAVVMKSKGLGYVREGNILRIAPLDQLQKEADMASQLANSRAKNDPLKVKVIPISYANVSDITKQAEKFLSERGKIAFDNRTSSIIVTDTAQVTDRIVRLIKTLDIPPDQVLIEGKIVEAQDQFKRNIGVQWGFGGSPQQISTNKNGGPVNLMPSLRVTPSDFVSNGMQFNMRVGTLDVFGDLTAALQLSESDNLVKVVSSPRIVALNREKAEISQILSVAIPTITIPAAGQQPMRSIRYEPAELKLDVTPQITADGSVIMDMEVKREFFSAPDTSTGDRAKNSRSAKSRIIVRSGQTAVIGGIYDNQETMSESGVPWLRKVPILGWLFKYRSRTKEKNELMIFLTPRILSRAESQESRE